MLVELLVVIAIIGILTAVGVPMYNGYQASAKVSATKQNFDGMKTFIAGEVTKCSAGLTSSLADPKAGCTTITCPSGLSAATYFTAYGLATMKNPYDSTSTAAVNGTIPPANNGEIGISGAATASCPSGVSIQAKIIDPATNTSTAYPAAAESISVQ